MSIWESIYKYESTTIQNGKEYKDIINEIKKKYGNEVIEIWSDEYLEKLRNCNGYFFQKKNKNFNDLINEKMNNENYEVWPLRLELLENENITNFLGTKKKKSKVISNYHFLNKKRNSSFMYNQENKDSVALENYRKPFNIIERKIQPEEELELKNKIKELEKKIKDLELKILQKDEIIKNENIKNMVLYERVNKLENLSKQNLQKRNLELENEIQLFRKYYNFSEGEKLISIKFISGAQDINYPLIAKNTIKFIKLEYILYEKYPKYMETVNYFLAGGNRINRNKTLEQNNIKNNDIITLIINNLD